MKIRKTWVGFAATEKPWIACFSHLYGSRGTDNLETKSNNMSKKLIVQTLLLVKQISFEIFMEDKKIKSMKINK